MLTLVTHILSEQDPTLAAASSFLQYGPMGMFLAIAIGTGLLIKWMITQASDRAAKDQSVFLQHNAELVKGCDARSAALIDRVVDSNERVQEAHTRHEAALRDLTQELRNSRPQQPRAQ